MPEYSARLAAAKAHYPFARWRDSGLPQYTAEACAKFVQVFDLLIDALVRLGPPASEEEKLACFHRAILALNALNEEDSSLIETGEREDLCELCNHLASAAGLDPPDTGDGEGPASEWRKW